MSPTVNNECFSAFHCVCFFVPYANGRRCDSCLIDCFISFYFLFSSSFFLYFVCLLSLKCRVEWSPLLGNVPDRPEFDEVEVPGR